MEPRLKTSLSLTVHLGLEDTLISYTNDIIIAVFELHTPLIEWNSLPPDLLTFHFLRHLKGGSAYCLIDVLLCYLA